MAVSSVSPGGAPCLTPLAQQNPILKLALGIIFALGMIVWAKELWASQPVNCHAPQIPISSTSHTSLNCTFFEESGVSTKPATVFLPTLYGIQDPLPISFDPKKVLAVVIKHLRLDTVSKFTLKPEGYTVNGGPVKSSSLLEVLFRRGLLTNDSVSEPNPHTPDEVDKTLSIFPYLPEVELIATQNLDAKTLLFLILMNMNEIQSVDLSYFFLTDEELIDDILVICPAVTVIDTLRWYKMR